MGREMSRDCRGAYMSDAILTDYAQFLSGLHLSPCCICASVLSHSLASVLSHSLASVLHHSLASVLDDSWPSALHVSWLCSLRFVSLFSCSLFLCPHCPRCLSLSLSHLCSTSLLLWPCRVLLPSPPSLANVRARARSLR